VQTLITDDKRVHTTLKEKTELELELEKQKKGVILEA